MADDKLSEAPEAEVTEVRMAPVPEQPGVAIQAADVPLGSSVG